MSNEHMPSEEVKKLAEQLMACIEFAEITEESAGPVYQGKCMVAKFKLSSNGQQLLSSALQAERKRVAIIGHKVASEFLDMHRTQRTYTWHEVEDALTKAAEAVRRGPSEGRGQMKDYKLRQFQIQICEGCLHSEGQECHTPGCVFWLCSTAEIEELLSRLCIRPRVDGKLLFEEILCEVQP